MEEFYDSAATFALPLFAAAVAGGLIGLEREYRGRPAGLRTHILVAIASALLMLAAVHQFTWMQDTPHEVIRIDPVRMAHGILTGIGFLCGGVIFRQGLTVHGLTTAASLWVTSALGTLYGMGLYGLAIGGTFVTLLVLGGFRWADHHVPQLSVIDVAVRYHRQDALPEPEFRALLSELKLTTSAITHKALKGGEVIELSSTVRGKGAEKSQQLAAALCGDKRVFEFEVIPRKD